MLMVENGRYVHLISRWGLSFLIWSSVIQRLKDLQNCSNQGQHICFVNSTIIFKNAIKCDNCKAMLFETSTDTCGFVSRGLA